MIQGTDFIQMIGGSEGCFRLTITDGACPNPTIANTEVNGAPTSAADRDNQNATDDIGMVYTDPFGVNTQGISTEGLDTSLEGYSMRFK